MDGDVFLGIEKLSVSYCTSFLSLRLSLSLGSELSFYPCRWCACMRFGKAIISTVAEASESTERDETRISNGTQQCRKTV